MKYDLKKLKMLDRVEKTSKRVRYKTIRTFYELDRDTVVLYYEALYVNKQYYILLDRLFFDTRKELVRNIRMTVIKNIIRVVTYSANNNTIYRTLAREVFKLFNPGIDITTKIHLVSKNRYDIRYSNLLMDVNPRSNKVYVEFPNLINYEFISMTKGQNKKCYDIFFHEYNTNSDILITMYNSVTKLIVQTLISYIDYAKSKDIRLRPQWNSVSCAYYVNASIMNYELDSKLNETEGRVAFHRFLLDLYDSAKEVDHRNLDSLDNRRENIRIVSQVENLRNKGIQKNNTTGVHGVQFLKKCDKYTSTIRGKQGKRLSRSFTISMFGKEEAFRLACEQRWKWEIEFGYRQKSTKENR